MAQTNMAYGCAVHAHVYVEPRSTNLNGSYSLVCAFRMARFKHLKSVMLALVLHSFNHQNYWEACCIGIRTIALQEKVLRFGLLMHSGVFQALPGKEELSLVCLARHKNVTAVSYNVEINTHTKCQSPVSCMMGGLDLQTILCSFGSPSHSAMHGKREQV